MREAAGRPRDVRWFSAHATLTDFVDSHRRYAPGGGGLASFVRLSNFLLENLDLAKLGRRGDPRELECD